MTPIGDSGYYITVDFNFTESERQKTPRLTSVPVN